MEDSELFNEIQSLLDKEEKVQRTIEEVLTYTDIKGVKTSLSHRKLMSDNFEEYLKTMVYLPYLNALSFRLKHSDYFLLYKKQYHILRNLFDAVKQTDKDIRNLTFNDLV